MGNLQESYAWQAGEVKDNVITDVKVLGSTSKNKTIYSTATRQNALKLFEGIKVNIDHVEKNKKVGLSSRFGKLVNVRNTEDGIRGDLHFVKSHPLANFVLECADNMPELLGLSINGEGGQIKDKDGNIMVESIDKLYSVDLVANPASTKGLKEEEDGEETLSSEEELWSGCKRAIMALLDEEGTPEEKSKKIKELLKNHDKMYGDPKEQEDGGESAQEESHKQLVNELKVLREEIDTLKKKSLVRNPISVQPNTPAKPVDYIKLIRGIN